MKQKRTIKSVLCAALSVVLLLQSSVTVAAEEEAAPMSQPGEVYAYDAGNLYGDRFFVPTQVYQYGGEFYIADAL